jgi:hypothetical protein
VQRCVFNTTNGKIIAVPGGSLPLGVAPYPLLFRECTFHLHGDPSSAYVLYLADNAAALEVVVSIGITRCILNAEQAQGTPSLTAVRLPPAGVTEIVSIVDNELNGFARLFSDGMLGLLREEGREGRREEMGERGDTPS